MLDEPNPTAVLSVRLYYSPCSGHARGICLFLLSLGNDFTESSSENQNLLRVPTSMTSTTAHGPPEACFGSTKGSLSATQLNELSSSVLAHRS